jgi:hypothetical protein
VPDLEGVWSFATLTPFERPPEFGDKVFITREEADAWVRQTVERNNRDRRDGGAEADLGRAYNDYWFDRGSALASVNGQIRTSLITDPADGRLPPLSPEARARTAARAADVRDHPADGPENRSLAERCLAFNAGPPMVPGPYNNYVQIFQMPGYVIVSNEMIHDARIIPLDGRAHVAKGIGLEMGDARGHWDGDSLVVETTNFKERSTYRNANAASLRLIERFSRKSDDRLEWSVTVDDPATWTRPWTFAMPLTMNDQEPVLEFACHEGNYAVPNILSAARSSEAINSVQANR